MKSAGGPADCNGLGGQMRLGWIVAVMAALAAWPAGAADRLPDLGELAPGYTYYNRPGATVEDHNREVADCVQRTQTWYFGPPKADPLGQGPIGGMVSHMIWDGAVAGLEAAQVENCMIVRGWRVVDIGEAQGRGLSVAPVSTLSATLAQEIGAASPSGVVVRQWGNELLRPGSFTIAQRPRTPGKQQLSLRLYAESSPPPVKQLPWPGQPVIDPVWPKGRLKASELGKAPPGSAIILIRVIRTGVGLARVGETPDDMPALRDHSPGVVGAWISPFVAKKEGDWFALAVPPGRWRLSSYCFGSPAFDVAAGDIVYAGTFRSEPDMTPDLSMQPALAWLGSEYASRARPAVYRNGSQGSCHGIEAAMYALEFPGAGYEPGYTWGGAVPAGQ